MTDQSPAPTNRRALGCLVEVAETLVLTVVLFWLIQSFVAQPFQVQQVSMLDTIHDGQYILVDRLTPRFDGYHRGDIIVFTPPTANPESPHQEPYIKRVIGVAGDTVELRDGSVYVNGTELVEPYIFQVNGEPQATTPESSFTRWTIGPGQLFVMGDHRAESSDSRAFGVVQVDAVIGRAWLRYWPINTLSVLPTSSHPELAGASARPSASAGTSAKPSAKPNTKPTAKPRPSRTPKP